MSARASTFDIAAASAPRRSGGMARRLGSGGGVLLVAFLQLCIGIVLLGLFEGYKVVRIKYFDKLLEQYETAQQAAQAAGKSFDFDPGVLQAQSAISNRSPMGVVFWLAIVNNTFAICGLGGVLGTQRELVMAFFAFSTVQLVAGAHFFIDMIVDTTVRYGGEPPGLTSYEKAVAFFLALQVLLAACATAVGVRAIEEIKQKHREDYSRLVTLGNLNDSSLQFEADRI
ncbi:hypothetical protein Rsub_10446 [Raphidocelis subcapitata]|uniref:Uncharacterized protein n=1 Tax=Raphidocelis subcapitata TaxID=307507 RepID=A0A2V0PHW8_9CHLO|nr:hypothetical protein Rsub_10446 [Raphidocelis subcapitata]|eukprot:GBF97523.1 hypothetical protein Rsub_10446 [Raphidocelis subcapitata]